LSFKQDDIVFNGHSIEARLYAENPANDFLPETGTLLALSKIMMLRRDGIQEWNQGLS
jgi:Acetyl/propionyl-CoA carboxylase, alpha subunit